MLRKYLNITRQDNDEGFSFLVGVGDLRHLYLLRVQWEASRPWCASFVRSVCHDG